LPELRVTASKSTVQASIVVLFCVLQLYCIALMAGIVKRSAVTRKATMLAAAAACWSMTVCWMGTMMVVAGVSEHDEGQWFVFSSPWAPARIFAKEAKSSIG